MDWPQDGAVVWLDPTRFLRIYSIRREHLRSLGVDVLGLDAVLQAIQERPEDVGVFIDERADHNVAFFLTRTRVLGSVVLRSPPSI